MNQNNEAKTDNTSSVESHLARHGGLSYIHIPAIDVQQSALFYEQVFGWKIRGRETDHPGFDDGTGHVSGAWVTDQEIARVPGLLPYIYVDDIDTIIQRIQSEGGSIVKGPDREGNLWVANFRDPAGNVLGIFH